jgi:hypothetical protein
MRNWAEATRGKSSESGRYQTALADVLNLVREGMRG